MKYKQILFLLLIIIIFCFLSCDKKNPTEPVKITDINGNWSGNTSQGYNFTFTVSNNKITKWHIKVKSGGMTQDINTYSCSVSINNNKFTLSHGYWPQPELDINGEFKSNTKCNGSFDFSGTTGTWSTSKN
ncbi:MAG: hypothetical protein ACFFDN_22325 [Candidatus Hodarchaeota archaeon]